MGVPELILDLRRKGYSIMADGGYLDISPADNLPHELVQQLRQGKAEILVELQRETRRQKVIALLEENPAIQRAYYTDTESDPDHVILAIAIRHVATCEMLIDRAKHDPFKLMQLIGQHGQVTH